MKTSKQKSTKPAVGKTPGNPIGKSESSKSSDLRQKAEKSMKIQHSKVSPDTFETDIMKLNHELQVHQIELELQNEGLVLAKEMAEVATRKYTQLFDYAPIGYCTLSRDGNIEEMNITGANMLGFERSHLLNSRFGFFISKETLPQYNLFLDNVFENNAKESCEITMVTKHGELKDILLTGIIVENANACSVNLIDITERKLAEDNLIKANRLYAVISKINQACVTIHETDRLFREVCRIAVDPGNFRMAWVGVIDEETKQVKPVAFAGFEDYYLSKIKIVVVGDMSGAKGPTGIAIREGKENVCNDIETDPRMKPWRSEALKRGYRSSIGLPLKISGKVIGVFSLYSSIPWFFTAEEVDLLVEVALNVSFSLEAIETEKKRKEVGASLKDSELKFKMVFETAPIGISIINPEHKIIEVNSSLEKILHLSKKELLAGNYLGRKYLRADGSEMLPDEFASAMAISRNRLVSDVETGILTQDGQVIWTLVSASPKHPHSGSVIVITQDITERKKVEENLQKSEEKWRSFVTNSPDYIALHDQAGRYLFLNRYAEGFSEKDVLGKNAIDFVSKKSRSIYKAAFEKCINTLTKQEIEYSALSDNEEESLYESSMVPLPQGNEIFVLVVARDITGRKKAEVEILKSKEQLEQLYKHLNEVREEERTNIAREIHDELGQSLAGLKIDLLGMHEEITDEVWSKQKIGKAISLVDSSIKTVQKISSQLRPQMLDELGLASAIEWQTNEVKKRTGIRCKLELEEIEDFDDKVPISLFRIFQASLTNIMLHSKAKSMSVKLAIKNGIVILAIKDDGIGITRDRINATDSFGIIGMQERAKHINGQLEIRTQKGKGTEIIVRVPMRRRNSNTA